MLTQFLHIVRLLLLYNRKFFVLGVRTFHKIVYLCTYHKYNMAQRGIIIYGLPRKNHISEIIDFANRFIAVKEYKIVERHGRTEFHIAFVCDFTILYEIAQQMRDNFGVNAQVKYLTEPDKQITQSKDPKEFGNPHIKKSPSLSEISKNSLQPKRVEKPSDNHDEKSPTAKLRIDLELNDIESLLEYLKSRTAISHQRKRYPDTNTPRKNNDSNRSTFIAQDILFDKRDVAVFINGKRTNEILCWVEEKSDAYILHLFYKNADISKTITIDKSSAIEPLRRIRYSDQNNSFAINGKAVAITFEGYEGYRRDKSKVAQKYRTNESSPSIIYEGKPIQKRRTAIVRQTNVIRNDDQINVKISDDNDSQGTDYKNSSALADLLAAIQQHHNDPKPSADRPITDESCKPNSQSSNREIDSDSNDNKASESKEETNSDTGSHQEDDVDKSSILADLLAAVHHHKKQEPYADHPVSDKSNEPNWQRPESTINSVSNENKPSKPSEKTNTDTDSNQEDESNENANALSNLTHDDVVQSDERNQIESESETESELKNDRPIHETVDSNQDTPQEDDFRSTPVIKLSEPKTETDNYDEPEKRNDDSQSLSQRIKRLYLSIVQWFHRFINKA